jgi:hypothetical protein
LLHARCGEDGQARLLTIAQMLYLNSGRLFSDSLVAPRPCRSLAPPNLLKEPVMAKNTIGKITQVLGAVVDVQCDGELADLECADCREPR